jgi:hypothetical protein
VSAPQELREVYPPAVADLVETAGWSSIWHTEDVITEVEAQAALADKLPFGTTVTRIELHGYNSGVDGTLVLVASVYSHS